MPPQQPRSPPLRNVMWLVLVLVAVLGTLLSLAPAEGFHIMTIGSRGRATGAATVVDHGPGLFAKESGAEGGAETPLSEARAGREEPLIFSHTPSAASAVATAAGPALASADIAEAIGTEGEQGLRGESAPSVTPWSDARHWTPTYTLESGAHALVRTPQMFAPNTEGADAAGLPSRLWDPRSDAPPPLRPTRSSGGVAVCFAGLIRFVGTLERTWRRSSKNLRRLPNRGVFVSTWNYIQTSRSLHKAHRERRRAWFHSGAVVTDMHARLASVFGDDLRGAYVANHTAASVCRFIYCVVSMVRAHGLLAIHQYEQQHGVHYPFLVFLRIDRSLELPLWFSSGCFSTSTSEAPAPPSSSSTNSTSCYVQSGFCTSYYRNHFYSPRARVADGRVVTHIFYTRFYSASAQVGFMSDYAAIGTRDSVATLLVKVVALGSRNLNASRSPEGILAAAANDAQITVAAINLAYERPAAMGAVPPMVQQEGVGVGEDEEEEEEEEAGDDVGADSAGKSESDDMGSASEQPSESVRVEDPEGATGDITCGSLAPKYMLDLCDSGGDGFIIPPSVRPHWKRAGKSCCASLRGCLNFERRSGKPRRSSRAR